MYTSKSKRPPYKQTAKEYRRLWTRLVTALGGRENLKKVFEKVNCALLSEYYATEKDTVVLRRIRGTALNIKVIEKPAPDGTATYTAILYVPIDHPKFHGTETVIATLICNTLQKLYPILLELVLTAYTVQVPRKVNSFRKIAIAALTPPTPAPKPKQLGSTSFKEQARPNTAFDRISGFWSTYLGHTIHPKDVAIMVQLLNIEQEAQAHTSENFMYTAAYVGLANGAETVSKR